MIRRNIIKKINKLQKSEQNKNTGFIACQASEHRQFNRWGNPSKKDATTNYIKVKKRKANKGIDCYYPIC